MHKSRGEEEEKSKPESYRACWHPGPGKEGRTSKEKGGLDRSCFTVSDRLIAVPIQVGDHERGDSQVRACRWMRALPPITVRVSEGLRDAIKINRCTSAQVWDRPAADWLNTQTF